MRRLKSLGSAALVLSALLMVSMAARAQEQEQPRRPDLGLSEEQKAQVEQIRSGQREQLEAIRQDTSLSPEEKRAKAREVRKKTRSQMESVLTPEQMEKLQKHRQELRNRRGRPGTRSGRRGQVGDGPPDAGGSPQ